MWRRSQQRERWRWRCTAVHMAPDRMDGDDLEDYSRYPSAESLRVLSHVCWRSIPCLRPRNSPRPFATASRCLQLALCHVPPAAWRRPAESSDACVPPWRHSCTWGITAALYRARRVATSRQAPRELPSPPNRPGQGGNLEVNPPRLSDFWP